MSDAASSQQPKQPALVEVKGVRLKYFEQVLVKLLKHVEPRYIPLPQPKNIALLWKDWDVLPKAAKVHGTLPGQLPDSKRAKRKEDQLKSMLRCIFALLEKEKDEGHKTIVDFGGGSGHLSIPLALLLPKCTIVCVDLKQKSLEFLHEKARACSRKEKTYHNPQQLQEKTLQLTAIPNLFMFAGDIESFQKYPFHIGVALHVCGEATDVVLRKCAQNKAHLVVAPCCVGKLSNKTKNPYIYQATNQNTPTIQYPQSRPFQQCLQCSTQSTNDRDWNALAKAADYNHDIYVDVDANRNEDRRNASRRTAKGLLELDRQLYLQETYAYQTALTRMDPLTASPKNDIMIGYYSGSDSNSNNNRCAGDKQATAFWDSAFTTNYEDPVVTWTKEHLLHPGAALPSSFPNKKKVKTNDDDKNSNYLLQTDGVDWTWEEEQEIKAQLTDRFSLNTANNSNGEATTTTTTGDVKAFVFPTGMKKRRRKMIHFAADQLGLAHWSVGKKNAEKTVAVRPRHVSSKEQVPPE